MTPAFLLTTLTNSATYAIRVVGVNIIRVIVGLAGSIKACVHTVIFPLFHVNTRTCDRSDRER